jgi:DNA-binding IclR family transcriptional regulator
LLWEALRDVPDTGADVAELMRMTGLGRSAVYKYLALLAEQGRAVKVGWGRWCAASRGEGDDE